MSTLPYASGSDTSLAAAQSLERDVESLRGLVADFVRGRALLGATCDEIEAALDLRHQTASPRVYELEKQRRLYDSGQRRMTRSGRAAIVWWWRDPATPGHVDRADALKSSDWVHWTTPVPVLERVRQVAPILLDPCGNEASLATVAARVTVMHGAPTGRFLPVYGAPDSCYTIGDGLALDWKLICATVTAPTVGSGLTFVNCPYGRAAGPFVEKMVVEAAKGVEIIGLLPARTDVGWMHDLLFKTAAAGCFWRGRIQFNNPPPAKCKICRQCEIGHAGCGHAFVPMDKTGSTIPSLIAYWGRDLDRFSAAFGSSGKIVWF